MIRIAKADDVRAAGKKKRRIRATAKWLSLGLALVVLVLWATSCVWDISYWRYYPPRGFYASIECGVVSLVVTKWEGDRSDIRWHVEYYRFHEGWSARYRGYIITPVGLWRILKPSWIMPSASISVNPRAKPKDHMATFLIRSIVRIHVPLWLPFLIFAIPASFLFWRDLRRRIPPGHCQQCRYNLTANTSGICPECGTPIPKEVQEKLATNPPTSNTKINTHGSQTADEQNN